jgi:hypothetical protein
MESFDLPEPAPLVVTEHRAHDCQCAACGAKTRAPFPDGVNAPVQYGATTSDGLPCDPSVGSVHATKGTIPRLEEERTILLRCESLEPPMSLVGQQRLLALRLH